MSEENGFLPQFKRNYLGLLSLLVALSALFYNTWRNESTEANRNVRVAEFEMLKNLSELQQVIDYAHYKKDSQRGDLTRGLTLVLQIHDLGELTPPPVLASSIKLQNAWLKHADQLNNSLPAASILSEEVLETRQIVLESLRHLK